MENEDSKVIKAYKGFDKDLKCRGFQYEVGKEYEIAGDVKCCKNGFHAVDGDVSPLQVFDYYEPSINGNRSRYCEVEVSGRTASDGNKVVGSKIKIGAEIGIPGLIRAHFEWVKRHITNENNAEAGQPATAGSFGAATAGDSGAATAGNRGAATSLGSVAVGKNGVATVRGNNIKAKGGLGAIITIAVEQDDSYDIKEWKTLVVDGETIKEDTWYTLKDGKFVEVDQ
jgi:hypothetical protein